MLTVQNVELNLDHNVEHVTALDEHQRVITFAITEPEPAIIHFKSTRKSGFACITLLSGDHLEFGINLN